MLTVKRNLDFFFVFTFSHSMNMSTFISPTTCKLGHTQTHRSDICNACHMVARHAGHNYPNCNMLNLTVFYLSGKAFMERTFNFLLKKLPCRQLILTNLCASQRGGVAQSQEQCSSEYTIEDFGMTNIFIVLLISRHTDTHVAPVTTYCRLKRKMAYEIRQNLRKLSKIFLLLEQC